MKAMQNYMTEARLNGLARQLRKVGFMFYRELFMWGRCPAIRSADSSLIYFFDQGDILTPAQMHERLRETWRPAAADEVNFAALEMAQFFEEMPVTPNWAGLTIAQMAVADHEAGFPG